MSDNYKEQRENASRDETTSPGLQSLLTRNKIMPTYIRDNDIKLAADFMPSGYRKATRNMFS